MRKLLALLVLLALAVPAGAAKDSRGFVLDDFVPMRVELDDTIGSRRPVPCVTLMQEGVALHLRNRTRVNRGDVVRYSARGFGATVRAKWVEDELVDCRVHTTNRTVKRSGYVFSAIDWDESNVTSFWVSR